MSYVEFFRTQILWSFHVIGSLNQVHIIHMLNFLTVLHLKSMIYL